MLIKDVGGEIDRDTDGEDGLPDNEDGEPGDGLLLGDGDEIEDLNTGLLLAMLLDLSRMDLNASLLNRDDTPAGPVALANELSTLGSFAPGGSTFMGLPRCAS